MEASLVILLLLSLSVFAIVMEHRFGFEKIIYEKYNVSRTWYIPVISLAIAIFISVISFSNLFSAFIDKIDIIVLIFSFGLMAEGLRESGFFKYIAYKVVYYCDGNVSKLIMLSFVVTSVLTLLTSNDIVIIVLTPIILEICFKAEIKNTKIILLPQFVAANTLSMGLLIGSPTNIIISEELNIGFFEYIQLMFLPTFTAFVSSYLLLRFLVKRNLLFFKFKETYELPDDNPEPYITKPMKNWIGIFSIFLISVIFVTTFRFNLLYCAVPSIVISVIYWYNDENHPTVRDPIKRLPYGILFFGIVFFTFAEGFGQTHFVSQELIPFLETLWNENPYISSITGVFGTGIMVNIFNDLPASALIAELLSNMNLPKTGKTVVVQSTLLGLNIGAYITQIGALAGIIWFSQIKTYRDNYKSLSNSNNFNFPSRRDLVKFGLINFIIVGLISSLVLTIKLIVLIFI